MTHHDVIVVCDYDPEWPRQFNELAARARSAIGPSVLQVEHVGSTAVRGLAAKPIVDVDVVVATESDVPEAIRRLSSIGYSHEGDLGIPGREAFRCPLGEKRHHLYLLIAGAAELKRHLAFRDALRSDANLRNEYAELKRLLATNAPADRSAYTNGKSAFVEKVLKDKVDDFESHPTIRRAREEDAQGILEAHHSAVHETAAKDYSAQICHEWSPAVTSDRIARYILKALPNETTVVADLGGTIAGFGSIVAAHDELRAVYVAARFAGRSIGSALLGELERLARNSGCKELRMDSSLTAERFYQRHGYTVLSRGLHRLNSGGQMACVTMRKVL